MTILTDKNRNDKSTVQQSDCGFIILNKVIKPVSQYATKDSYKLAFKKACKGVKNWSLSYGSESLKDALELGYTIQCVYDQFMGSREKDTVTHSGIFTIDIDNWNKDEKRVKDDAVSLSKIINTDIVQNNIIFYQLSLSQNSDLHPNLHLFGIFDKNCTDMVQREIFITTFITRLKSELGLDPSSAIVDPTFAKNKVQVIYPGRGKCIDISPDSKVNVGDFAVEYAKEWAIAKKAVDEATPGNATPSKKSTYSQGISEEKSYTPESKRNSLLEHIQSEIVDKLLEGDFTALYSKFYDHKFSARSKVQYDGCNPFTNNSSGTSFTITSLYDDLPPVWNSRAGVPENIQDEINKSTGGDVISYLILLHRQNTITQGRINPLAKYPLKRQYYEAYADICRSFKVEPIPRSVAPGGKSFDKKDLDEAIALAVQNFVETAPIYIHRAMWENQDEKNYHYFDFVSGLWRVTKSTSILFSDCIIHWLDCPESLKEEPKLSTAIFNKLNKTNLVPFVQSRLEFDLSARREIIPLKNGDYDTINNIFTEGFNPQNYNVSRGMFDWKPVTGKGVEVMDKWLSLTYGEAEQKLVKAWIIANCQGIAKKTKRILNIYGTPGTGKSTLMNLLKHCLANLAVAVDGSSFLDKNNKFSGQQLDGCNALLIDEFNADLNGWERLKKMSGNATSFISIEKKGKTPYEVIFNAGITTTTQDHFRLPASDDGGVRRRVIPLRHTASMANPELKNMDELISDPEIYQDIYLWAIQQDGKQAVADVVDYAENDGKETLLEVIQYNDKILSFASEVLEFTNDENDTISNVEMIDSYRIWVEDVHQEVHNKNDSKDANRLAKTPQYIKERAMNPDNKLGWSMCPEKGKDCKVKRGSSFIRGMKGVKFKDTAQDYNPNRTAAAIGEVETDNF